MNAVTVMCTIHCVLSLLSASRPSGFVDDLCCMLYEYSWLAGSFVLFSLSLISSQRSISYAFLVDHACQRVCPYCFRDIYARPAAVFLCCVFYSTTQVVVW